MMTLIIFIDANSVRRTSGPHDRKHLSMWLGYQARYGKVLYVVNIKPKS